MECYLYSAFPMKHATQSGPQAIREGDLSFTPEQHHDNISKWARRPCLTATLVWSCVGMHDIPCLTATLQIHSDPKLKTMFCLAYILLHVNLHVNWTPTGLVSRINHFFCRGVTLTHWHRSPLSLEFGRQLHL